MKTRNIKQLLAIYVIVICSSFTLANLAEKLNKIVDKDPECITVDKTSILVQFLQNITTAVGQFQRSFDQWTRVNNHNRINRQALSGCELISTDLPMDKPIFFLCKIELNWHMADQYCRVHGMRLAVLDNSVAFDYVIRFLKNYRGMLNIPVHAAWIGCTDLGNEGNWYWAPNGKLVFGASWLPGQPDNYKNIEHCCTICKGRTYPQTALNDRPCDYRTHFICESNYAP